MQKTLGYSSKEIEVAFKEETNSKRSDIYEIYSQTTMKIITLGKEKAGVIVLPHSKGTKQTLDSDEDLAQP